jgi:hypothetical protein
MDNPTPDCSTGQCKWVRAASTTSAMDNPTPDCSTGQCKWVS